MCILISPLNIWAKVGIVHSVFIWACLPVHWFSLQLCPNCCLTQWLTFYILFVTVVTSVSSVCIVFTFNLAIVTWIDCYSLLVFLIPTSLPQTCCILSLVIPVSEMFVVLLFISYALIHELLFHFLFCNFFLCTCMFAVTLSTKGLWRLGWRVQLVFTRAHLWYCRRGSPKRGLGEGLTRPNPRQTVAPAVCLWVLCWLLFC